MTAWRTLKGEMVWEDGRMTTLEVDRETGPTAVYNGSTVRRCEPATSERMVYDERV
jgi:hypothetical protein